MGTVSEWLARAIVHSSGSRANGGWRVELGFPACQPRSCPQKIRHLATPCSNQKQQQIMTRLMAQRTLLTSSFSHSGTSHRLRSALGRESGVPPHRGQVARPQQSTDSCARTCRESLLGSTELQLQTRAVQVGYWARVNAVLLSGARGPEVSLAGVSFGRRTHSSDRIASNSCYRRHSRTSSPFLTYFRDCFRSSLSARPSTNSSCSSCASPARPRL